MMFQEPLAFSYACRWMGKEVNRELLTSFQDYRTSGADQGNFMGVI